MLEEEKKDVTPVEDEKIEVVATEEEVKDDAVEVVVDDKVVEDEKKDAEATVIEADKSDDSLVIEVADETKVEETSDKKSKKKKNKKDKKADKTEVVVENIPSEVVSTKEQKKGKKVASFFAFATIILALVFTIVDWTVESVTKNSDPQIVLHLMDWISILLYLSICVKALPFLANKKKWVKVMFWICVIATLVCILVPMIMDYVDLAEAIQKANEEEAAKQAQNALMMFVA